MLPRPQKVGRRLNASRLLGALNLSYTLQFGVINYALPRSLATLRSIGMTVRRYYCQTIGRVVPLAVCFH